MKLLKINYGPFRRIGNRYRHFINDNHFLGRDAFEEPWMSKCQSRGEREQKEVFLNQFEE
ncbi:MAG: hypothetical protein AAF600_17530 [Bacteroidota bacterium]